MLTTQSRPQKLQFLAGPRKKSKKRTDRLAWDSSVVEARGRLGEEVLPFLRHHAPAEEPLRSAVLARALRDISIITQQGLAALLLAAEPRHASV